MSLSHISLMVQPAPRMTRAPAANIASVSSGGRTPGAAARAILQPQGQNNSQDPAQTLHHPKILLLFSIVKQNRIGANFFMSISIGIYLQYFEHTTHIKHFLYCTGWNV